MHAWCEIETSGTTAAIPASTTDQNLVHNRLKKTIE